MGEPLVSIDELVTIIGEQTIALRLQREEVRQLTAKLEQRDAQLLVLMEDTLNGRGGD